MYQDSYHGIWVWIYIESEKTKIWRLEHSRFKHLYSEADIMMTLTVIIRLLWQFWTTLVWELLLVNFMVSYSISSTPEFSCTVFIYEHIHEVPGIFLSLAKRQIFHKSLSYQRQLTPDCQALRMWEESRGARFDFGLRNYWPTVGTPAEGKVQLKCIQLSQRFWNQAKSVEGEAHRS